MIVKVKSSALRRRILNNLENKLPKIEKRMNLIREEEAAVTNVIDNYKSGNVKKLGDLLMKQIKLRCDYQKVLHKFFDLQVVISRLKR